MREIKFRAWYENKMVNFSLNDLVVSGEGEYYWIDNNPPIMQYTGLKDLNGVEIYEGDILKDTDEDVQILIDNRLAELQAANKPIEAGDDE